MNGKMLLNSLKGAAIGLAAALILLLIFNFISLKTQDPDRLVPFFAHAAQFIGGAVAGFAASRFHRMNGMISGAIAGGFYAIIILLGAAFSEGEFSVLTSLLICAGILAVSAVTGILGLPGEKSGKAKRRDMMKRSGLKG